MVLHGFLHHKSFPQAAVLHKLLHCGCLLWGAVPQEQIAPAQVLSRLMSAGSKSALALAPLSTGVQNLPEAYSRAGSPQGHSLLQASTSSNTESSMTCSQVLNPTVNCQGLQGTACLTRAFTTGVRAISAPAAGAPLPPFTASGVCRAVSVTFSLL